MFIKLRLGCILLLLMTVVLFACNKTISETALVNESMPGDDVKGMIDSSSLVVAEVEVMATTTIVTEWVNQVGGNRISADSIMPHSVNPHTYQPSAKDVAKITQSKQIFAIGLMYERSWLTKLLDSYPDISVVNLGDFIAPIEFNDSEAEHDHNRRQSDPHFWLDPTRASVAVTKIANVLSEIDPDGAAYYDERAGKYTTALDELDRYIVNEILRIPDSNRRIMTEHESLGYLGDRYNVEILRSVIPNFSSESGPTPKDLAVAINLINKHDIPVIFVENEMNDKSAERVVEETGIKLAKGLSVETLRDGQTYIDFIKYNIGIIVSNLVD